jgi:hypothetical protein
MVTFKVLDINSRYFKPCEANSSSILNREYLIADYGHGAYYIVSRENDPILPKHINNIMEYARNQGCSQLRVDCDGNEYEQFVDFIDYWD